MFCEGRRFGLLALVVSVGSLWVVPTPLHADARTDYLVRLLAGSSQFRVRAQAAISLGDVDPDPRIVEALTAALRDEHPAVRAASANSLGRLGEASAVPALEAATRDREGPVRMAANAALAKIKASANRRGERVPPAVPSGPPRYYVAVARPSSSVSGLEPSVLERALQLLRGQLEQVDGVVLAPANENAVQALAILKRRRLRGFFIESSVTRVESKPSGGTRVAVSLILATYPGRDMRAILNGAATASGGRDAREQAMVGAFTSALRRLPQALQKE